MTNGSGLRTALPTDAPRLQQIERLAGARFADIGMASIADDAPPALSVYEQAATDGRLWVVESDGETGGDRQLAGYSLGVFVGGQPHLEQVSIVPDAQGTGRGRLLVEAVVSWATASGASAITLATFRDVEWNRPLYEHLGFVVLADDELSASLAALRRHEREIGLDAAGARVVMRRSWTTE